MNDVVAVAVGGVAAAALLNDDNWNYLWLLLELLLPQLTNDAAAAVPADGCKADDDDDNYWSCLLPDRARGKQPLLLTMLC